LPIILGATCCDGDRTTKLATASPSHGGLCYGPILLQTIH